MAVGRDMIATLVAHDGLGQGDVSAARDALAVAGLDVGASAWIEAGEAVDLPFSGNRGAARAALEALDLQADIFVIARANRDCRLFVADMDSTMITVECIDELADYAGLKAQIAEVTERAMRGELDFAEALSGRVALLAGLAEDVIEQCRTERVRLMGGAKALVQTLNARGAHTILVSGGFMPFAVPVGQEIGFQIQIANVLHIAGGKLAGTVAEPIVDAARKRAELLGAIAALGIAPAQAIAIGDGANDIPMIQAAGLGIAYHAKPKTRAAADVAIERGDLSTLLHALGIARKDWAEA
ncbi:phosphoserine phosphatase SerB [Sphingobium nicotianae]|uniref:Phosphoserine phosphatase n=1 Tax=Sphingobium nicotianae TaxID=2782607 RepID=A0A9X1D809_9SPHN|nr:phosphoserine phosphatase SerB [Sphingobium nicotianae]MBT2185702.1 phosphoserine phosphatase SerB [Sphingobium nicotianae]